jgi:predicted TIM-barrel fold metal-dependent hydrolase
MAVTDAHHHVWDIAARPQPWLKLPGNEPLRRSYGAADALAALMSGPEGVFLRGIRAVGAAGLSFDLIVFGSDWPVCTMVASYSQVLACACTLTASLSQVERSAIFGGTARRVYRLPG